MDVEATKGSSPLGGAFTLSYGADFTDDIDFDASNFTVKAALEALPSIDQVSFSSRSVPSSFSPRSCLWQKLSSGC